MTERIWYRARSIFLYCIGVWAVLPAHIEAQTTEPSAPTVNVLADPGNWKITGVREFSEESIRRGLIQHPEFLAASYPGSGGDAVFGILKDLIERGYRHEGFSEIAVSVSSSYDGSTVYIHVEEGPKYRAGRIEIQGAVRIDVPRLRKWCSTVIPRSQTGVVLKVDDQDKPVLVRNPNGNVVGPEHAQLEAKSLDSPVWESGSEISLRPDAWSEQEKFLDQGFKEQGFYNVRYAAELIPDPRTQTIVLRITIQSEGPPSQIDSIAIAGLDHREQQHFLKMFNLQPGQQVSLSRCRSIEAELRKSGRFRRHSCIAVPQILQPELADVYVDVRKSKDAPPIDQALTDSQRRIVKLTEWLDHQAESDFDVILQVDIGKLMEGLIETDATTIPESFHTAGRDVILRIVLAASGDLVFETRNRKGDIDVAILMTESEIFLKSASEDPVRFLGEYSRPFMKMTVNGLPDNPQNRESSFGYNLGINSNEHLSKSEIRIAPFVGIKHLATDFLRELPNQPGDFDFSESPESWLRIDPDSGRLIEFHHEYASMATAKGVVDQFRMDHLQSVQQVSGQRLDTQQVDSSELCMAAGNVVLSWLAERDSKFREGPVFRLADRRVWLPLVESVLRPQHEKRFWVPATGQMIDPIMRQKMFEGGVSLLLKRSDNQAVAQTTLLLAKLFQGAAASIQLFPFESLPWQLNRDLQLLTEDQSAGALKLIARIREDQFGPLSGFYATALMGSISADLRHVCALQTLKNIDQFDRDREWLLTDQTLSHGLIETAAEVCRRLEPAEIAKLLKSITGNEHDLSDGEHVRKTLPGSLEEPIAPALPDFTDALWERAFRPIIKDRLALIVESRRSANE